MSLLNHKSACFATALAAVMTASAAHAAMFTISTVTSTSADNPANTENELTTETIDGVVVLPQNFTLNDPGDMFTFDGPLYFTDETTAEQPDDENMPATTITVGFTGPAAASVVLQGVTFGDPKRGGVFPVGPFEAGLVTFDEDFINDGAPASNPLGGPKQVLVGDFLLQVEALETTYNNGTEPNTLPIGPPTVDIGLQTSSSGQAFGAQVPIKVTLIEVIPEPATASMLGLAGLGLVSTRSRRTRSADDTIPAAKAA